MRAGRSPKEDENSASVRPMVERDKMHEVELMANEKDSDADDEEGIDEHKAGVEPERIALPKDSDHIKKVVDPKLPSKEEVEHHNLNHSAKLRSARKREKGR